MAKIKIKKSELDQIIKEEYAKVKAILPLRKELEKINESIKKIEEGTGIAEEVKVTGDSQIRGNILKITIRVEIDTKINQRDMKEEEINMRITIMISEM